MTPRFTIVGLGEALFDILPDAQHAGGAPLNVAVHAHQLGKGKGGRGIVVSRVGQDDLGQQLAQELTRRGMDISYLQGDPDFETGKVYVELSSDGQPSYEIVQNAAWDVLQFDPDIEELARRCQGVCFGSLAQRHAQSRNSIYRFLAAARSAVRLFDVNLRGDFFDASILRRSCEQATIVKLNLEELPIVLRLAGLPGGNDPAEGMHALLKTYELKMVVLTRGAAGTVLLTPNSRHEGPPVHYPPAPQADAVGAGDACSAALLTGLALRLSPDKLVNLANHAGAFVASQPGATPGFPQSILELLG